MNIRELQADIQKVQDWKWPEDKNKPLPTLAKLMEELGELSKAVNYSYPAQDTGYEIADVILVALGLAERLGLQADDFIGPKWDIVKDRLGYTEAHSRNWEQIGLFSGH